MTSTTLTTVYPPNQAEAAAEARAIVEVKFQITIHLTDGTSKRYARVARPTEFTALAVDRLQGQLGAPSVEWISVVPEIID